jgi:hypothetical protein
MGFDIGIGIGVGNDADNVKIKQPLCSFIRILFHYLTVQIMTVEETLHPSEDTRASPKSLTTLPKPTFYPNSPLRRVS